MQLVIELKSLDEAQWRERLTPDQYRICRQAQTEPPFSGRYYFHDQVGCYHCVCCNGALFSSEQKYLSGQGWPSFWAPLHQRAIKTRLDERGDVIRTQVVCARCQAHLGHLFEDGPPPTGLRFSINSAALKFVAVEV